MSGFYVGLPGLGSAYVEVRREWLGTGLERREHDAVLWAGWLEVTLSKPSRKPKETREIHHWMAKEERRERRLVEAMASYLPRPRWSLAAVLGFSAMAFTGGVTASTIGERMTSIFFKVEKAQNGQCLSQDAVKTTADWTHFTVCNLEGPMLPDASRKVSGVSDDGHPVDFQATGEMKLATVDRDLVVEGSDGFQRIRVPGVDQYVVERVYQDNKGRLVLKGHLPENDEAVRIRFEKIEEIELDDVVIRLQ